MGRPRKMLETQKGNLTVIQQETREYEEKRAKSERKNFFTPPEWLTDKTAKKEYRRVIKLLEKMELIGDLDITNISGYCNAFANYVNVSEQLSQQKYYVERETNNGVIVVKNPLVDIQTTYANEMRRFEQLIGMSVDSRLKLASAKTSQEKDSIRKKFGDI